jgi:hypothetical protein
LSVIIRQTSLNTGKKVEKKVMAQKFIQSSHYEYVVESVPSYMEVNGAFVKDGFSTNRRTDNMAVLGKCTDRYGLVQNTDLVNAAEDAFTAAGMSGFSRRVVVAGEGERFYAVYDFKSITREVVVGDEVGLRLTLQNSFDGSLRASFCGGILRLRCLNGAVSIEREVGLTQKHGSQVSVKFVADALVKARAAWDKSIQTFSRLSDVSITQAQGENILANLGEGNVFSGKVLEGIKAIWANPSYKEDESRNLWNLYNAVTQHLTHGVSGERFELADRVSRNALAALDKAAKSHARLDILTAPVVVA